MAKGIAQHLFPYLEGWAVYESWNPDTLFYFDSEAEALRFAHNQACSRESRILLCQEPPSEVLNTFVMLRPALAEDALAAP